MPHARAARKPQPNRADLTRPTAQTVPGQGYGEAAQQRVAQQQIPMGPPPTPQAQPAPQPSNPSPGGLQSVLGTPLVGANGSITRPTERPNEPVTHGLPVGPGPGPEALNGIGAAARQGAVQQGTLTDLLTSLAAQPNATSAIQDLAARAQAGVQ